MGRVKEPGLQVLVLAEERHVNRRPRVGAERIVLRRRR